MRCSAADLILGFALMGEIAAGNLISNGSFESGATFSTEYRYSTDLTSPGTVVVGYDPCDHHSAAASFGDHTSGRGRMLIANGSTDGDLVIWQQTVEVSPHTEYAFYYWLSAWTPSAVQTTQIRCRFNAVKTGQAGFASVTAGQWGLVLFRWNSESNSQVRIQLVDRAGTVENNGFALDDIGMLATGGHRILMAFSTLGGWVDSPGEGAFLYSQGESVVVEARCEPGYEFAGWAGEFSDSSPRIWVQMDADRAATATFRGLDYPVTIQASGALANELSLCSDSGDKLGILRGAMESGEPNGLVLGERKGLCDATYLFPIFKPPLGGPGLAKVIVNIYGRTLSSGATAWIGGDGPHRPIAGGVHCSFGPAGLEGLLDDSQEFAYWLPVRIDATMGVWDLGAICVSYDCPGIPEHLLRRFHDELSIYQALQYYANSRNLQDLYELRSNDGAVWDTVVRTAAFAEDLAGLGGISGSAVRREIGDLPEALESWQSLEGPCDLASLAGCDTAAIVTCLDEAVASGRLYLRAYVDALGDGEVSEGGQEEINQRIAAWEGDLIALDAAMEESFEALCIVHQDAATPQSRGVRVAAETLIRAMAPWRFGRLDDLGNWTLLRPTYLEQAIRSLHEHGSP